jgi:hypothetical protein
MGENCNGLLNRIGGNGKIAKALDIKEDLDINCLIYCKHCINFRHKENKNDLKQMFQCKLACTAVTAQNIHEAKVQVGFRKEAQALYALASLPDT